MRITRIEALEKIKQSKGRFFGTTFRKKNGELRTMNCQLLKEQPQLSIGYILVEDTNLKLKKESAIRIVNIQTLVYLKIGGETYNIK